MPRLMDLISHILTERLSDVSQLIIDDLLDDLIEIILRTWQKNPEMCFEELREKVINQMREKP